MLASLIIFIFCVQYSKAVIYHLNESSFSDLPPLFVLAPYEPCLRTRSGAGAGVYCHAHLHLLPPDQPDDQFYDQSSRLYRTITEYSARTETNFNHTHLSHGICLTETCNKYYQKDVTADLRLVLEACLNDTFWERYKLNVRVSDKYSCHTTDEKTPVDNADVLVAVVIATLLVLNLVGSLRDFFFSTGKEEPFWSCFSIARNWRKLVGPAAEDPDSRTGRLQGLYGLKCMCMAVVISVHAMLPFYLNLENVHDYEEAQGLWRYQIVISVGLVVQCFFLMSGMLMSYNLQLHWETARPSWQAIRKNVINRWIRLTPPYALVLAVTATWMRHFGSGPLWQPIVMPEVEDCRRRWWLNVLLVNNYEDNSICALHAWYIAADFQLYIIGLLACTLTTGRRRIFLFVTLFAAGVLSSAAHTYMQDLDGVMMMTPEINRNLFLEYPTFNHTYKRGHTNLASYALGLSLGLLVYRWQNNGYKFNLRRIHRFLLLLTVPALVALLWSCSIFFREAPRASVYIRVLYAALMKPLFAAVFGVIIVGMVFKFENVYRNFLEWSGWTAPANLCYCAYLIHSLIIKVINGTRATTNTASFMLLLEQLISKMVLSFLAAVPLYLLVEAPMRPLVKILWASGRGGSTGGRGAGRALADDAAGGAGARDESASAGGARDESAGAGGARDESAGANENCRQEKVNTHTKED